MTDINKHISTDRKDFKKNTLSDERILDSPFDLFSLWLREALDKMAMEPYAFTLATCKNNQPTSRIVYLRSVEEDGYVFFTNYSGRKGQEIEENDKVSMNFFWAEMERQVRIEGTVEKIAPEFSDAYFAGRPRASQVGAWASHQSEELNNFNTLEERFKAYEAKYKNKEVPRPKHWGGYIIKPTYFEFWQGRPNRLHDRIVYTPESNSWKTKRINP